MTRLNYNVAPHFTYRELACRHCGAYTIDTRLLLSLEWVRHLFSKCLGADTPILVTSGYRCPQHNADVGGSANSQHMLGLAADIKVPEGIDFPAAYGYLLSVPPIGAIGLYPPQNFIHIDVRALSPRGELVTWCVKKPGTFLPVEAAWSK